jgi:hypothetical protein
LLAIAISTLASCNRPPEPAKQNIPKREQILWPPLPTKGFIAGRTATKEDLARGDAAFFLGMSDPIKIEIPQYAFHIDEQTGKRSAGIIIQGERTPYGKELVAMQPIDGGGHVVALLAEYKLLGKAQPNGE